MYVVCGEPFGVWRESAPFTIISRSYKKDDDMKKFVLMILLIVSLAVKAQKDVTKFLGIPVDGLKPAMIQKLKAKSFNGY